VRQVGGALGIAVLGSLISSVYRTRVADGVADLPAAARSVASESISGAYGVAAQAGPAGPRLITSANDAFVSAMHWAAGGGVLVAVLGIVVVLAWLPRRSAAHTVVAPSPAPAARELVEATT